MFWTKIKNKLAEETSEKLDTKEIKFYFIESSKEYLIGYPKDDLFYAGYVPGIGWVWHYSLDTPWGLERKGTPGFYYPSEPLEVDFFTWLEGTSKQICCQAYEIVEEQLTELTQGILNIKTEELSSEAVVNDILIRVDISDSTIREILYSDTHPNKCIT